MSEGLTQREIIANRQAAVSELCKLAIDIETDLNSGIAASSPQRLYEAGAVAVSHLDDEADRLYTGELVEVEGAYYLPRLLIDGAEEEIHITRTEEFGIRRGIAHGFLAQIIGDGENDPHKIHLYHHIGIGPLAVENGIVGLSGGANIKAPVARTALTVVRDAELLEQMDLYESLSQKMPPDLFDDLNAALYADQGQVDLEAIANLFDRLCVRVTDDVVDECLELVNNVSGIKDHIVEVMASMLLELTEGQNAVMIDTPEVVNGICSQLGWGPTVEKEDGVYKHSNKRQISMFVRSQLEGEERERLLLIGGRQIQALAIHGVIS